MKCMGKTMLKKGTAFLLALFICLSGLTLPAEAAANKALAFDYEFNGKSLKKNAAKNMDDNGYGATCEITLKPTSLKGLTLGGDFYIPKKALKKKGAIVSITSAFDLFDAEINYAGDVYGKIEIQLVNKKGKVQMYAVDTVSGKKVNVSKYATRKSGTGKYKSYYVVKVRNIPLVKKVTRINGKKITIKKNTKFGLYATFIIHGQKNKGTGRIYMDNVKVMSGNKKIGYITFSSKKMPWGVWNRGGELRGTKAAIVKF